MRQRYATPALPRPFKQGLYDPQFEHEACGVGLVANINGVKSHKVIAQGLEVLINLGHRGAAGADPETGDGAGILVQMPHEFLERQCRNLGIGLPERGAYGVGMVFLPREQSQAARCKQIIERVVAEDGRRFLGWRDVPVDPDAIGTLSARVRPEIRQFFVGGPDSEDGLPLELSLFVIRRQIENAVAASGMPDAQDFYISSLSSTKVVYKGLIMAHQLEHFYHDLNDESMVTSFALIHSRFSTNTLGSWKLAHPYRYVIHNGEINTLRGNINWMAAREAALSSPLLGERVRKLLPIVSPAQSDTATFDNVLDLLLATGRSLPHALMMMIPEAWAEHIPMEQSKKDFYEYHSCLMEPWDGPALIIGTDGTKVCAILDRNGLRPCRYLVTTDDVLVMASETGVLDVPPEKVRYKWRIQPGRMFMLDTEQGRIVDDAEIKTELTGRRPYGRWLSDNRVALEDLPEASDVEQPDLSTLTERQKAFGYSLEDIGMIIEPMAETGAEPVGSMGNDAPLAVLSDQIPLLYGYFKQLFAQVSNPPLDAIREELVTSVEAFVGSEGNLFDEAPGQCRQLKVSEPILRNAELAKIKEMDRNGIRSATLSTLFRPGDGPGAWSARWTCSASRRRRPLERVTRYWCFRTVESTRSTLPYPACWRCRECTTI